MEAMAKTTSEPSLFKLAVDVDAQLLEDGVPEVDSGYQELGSAEAFNMAMDACETAQLEPGIHRLCAPEAATRRIFCHCVAAALQATRAEVMKFEAKDNDEYAWMLSNYSIILVVENDEGRN